MVGTREILVVDAQGLSCPQPVILARQAIKSISTGLVEVLVDTGTQRDNIIRLASMENWSARVDNTPDGAYRITLEK